MRLGGMFLGSGMVALFMMLCRVAVRFGGLLVM
jgi:hypothetical protein